MHELSLVHPHDRPFVVPHKQHRNVQWRRDLRVADHKRSGPAASLPGRTRVLCSKARRARFNPRRFIAGAAKRRRGPQATTPAACRAAVPPRHRANDARLHVDARLHLSDQPRYLRKPLCGVH